MKLRKRFLFITLVLLVGSAVIALLFGGCNSSGGSGGDTGTLYIADNGGGRILVLDLASKTVTKTITLETGAKPDWLTLSPDRSKLYCSSNEATTDYVYMIDTAANSYTKRLSVCPGPRGIAFTPDGSKAVVACNDGGDISVIDDAAETVLYDIYPDTTTTIYGIATHPTLNRYYVTCAENIESAEILYDSSVDIVYDSAGSTIWDLEM